MKFTKNNIDFEIIEKDGKWLLKSNERVLEICETKKECITASNFYEYITVPFTIL